MRVLPSWQLPFLGIARFPRALTQFEINTFFTFDELELDAIRTRRGDALRLASGVHLGFLKMSGMTLDALDRIPMFVLAHVAGQIDVPSMDIATVRSLYRRRRRTLFEHQRWAMATLGIEPFTVHRERALIRAFSPTLASISDTSAVALELMRWLYTRGILIPAARRIRSLATRVVRRAEGALAETLLAEIPNDVRRHWDDCLFAARSEISTTCLEWLGTPPSRRSTGALITALEKRAFLQLELGVPDYPLRGIRVDNLADLAKRCRDRKPSRAGRLQESTRALEIACFLRHTWLEINDTVLSLADGLTTDLRRQARDRSTQGAATELTRIRALLGRVRTVVEDTFRTDREVREYVLSEIPERSSLGTSRAWQHREALIADRRRVRRLLESFTTPRLMAEPGSPLEVLLKYIEQPGLRYRQPLPAAAITVMPPRWRAHLVGRETAATHAVFDAAALIMLQRALKNGSVWAVESLSYLRRDALLIDEATWQSERIARYRELNLHLKCGTWLRQRLDHLESGLEGVRQAVEAGTLPIDERGVILVRPGAERTDRLFERARKRLIDSVDAVQFSKVIVDIDQAVRFSWQLLQRPPRSHRELLAVYSALLVHGTARSVSDVALMMPSIRASDISDALSLLDQRDVLRSANDTVVGLMYREPITKYWGSGTAVSSDGMSLDVSRSL